jgi:hypothetical protein
MAILLIGGCKTADDGRHKKFMPLADRLSEAHFVTLRQEGEL